MKNAKIRFLIYLFIFSALLFQTSGIVFAAGELDDVTKVGAEALGYIQIAGSIFAIGVLVVYGIRWFMANSSERASLKSQAWVYLVGALLIFGGTFVAKNIIEFVAGAIYISPVKETTSLIHLLK
ncbi:MAG: hypothetical protein ACM3UU_03530 [Ignavibacteriales bacterium]